jgi:poly-gamma-glutamate synthesis protein (capsule biosynthesis protein)
MKRKYNIFILILLIGSISFLSACNLTPDIQANKNGTNPLREKESINMEEENPKEEIVENKVATGTILAAGDIMFHIPQVKSAYDSNSETYDFRDVFKYVKKYIDSSDLSLANFETVTAGGDVKYSGFPNFNSPKETLEAIKYSGFDILSTANNHCLDQKKNGLINTIDSIEEQGMKNIGTYEEPNPPIMIEEINEIRVALLSYTYGFNGMEGTLTDEEQKYMVNKIDEDKIKEDIGKAKDLGVDTVVVFIHWGNEYQREPSEEQLELGRKMVEWGANIVFGSHPHVIQKTEIINHDGKDNFIIYSMGNFLSNQCEKNVDNKYTEDGVMVKVQLEKDLSKGETIIKDISYIPTWVRRYKDNNKLKYEIIPIEDFLKDEELQSKIEKSIIMRMKESYDDTIEVMTEY